MVLGQATEAIGGSKFKVGGGGGEPLVLYECGGGGEPLVLYECGGGAGNIKT